MAHKKGVGSTDNGRDSNSKRLGVKLFGGQHAVAGNILVRQRGTKFHPGVNVYMGRDFTLHARIDGFVTFTKKRNNKTYVNITESLDQVAETVAPVRKAKPAKAAPKPADQAPPADTNANAAKEAPKAEAPKAAAPAAAKNESSDKPDNLKKVEGIGPKVAGLLNDAGIMTFAALGATSVDKIKTILEEAGPRYRLMDPTTWPQQAQMAADGKWDELEKWQDELDGGKIVSDSKEEE